MNIGMGIPTMEAGLDRRLLRAWCERIDQGPWSCLAVGERIAFANPEFITTLAAAAAWTARAELVSTVAVAPLHNPVVLAKQLATVDLLSDGRLTVGVGSGGRREDYRAAGIPWERHTLDALHRQVDSMQAVWRGDIPEGLPRPVEPRPVRGHIPVLAGAIGPRAIARAAQYAGGLCGFSFAATAADIAASFRRLDDAWQAAGRSGTPRKMSGFWFAVGEPARARAQVEAHLRHYLTWMPKDITEAIVTQAGFAGTLAQLQERLAELRATGADDIVLVPTTRDPAQLAALETALS